MVKKISAGLKVKVHLLDKYDEDIKAVRLPSNRQVLGYFLYLDIEKKLRVQLARIPVRHKQDAIKKMKESLKQGGSY